MIRRRLTTAASIFSRLAMADTLMVLGPSWGRRRRESYNLDPATGKLIKPLSPARTSEAAAACHAHYADRHAAQAAPAAG